MNSSTENNGGFSPTISEDMKKLNQILKKRNKDMRPQSETSILLYELASIVKQLQKQIEELKEKSGKCDCFRCDIAV